MLNRNRDGHLKIHTERHTRTIGMEEEGAEGAELGGWLGRVGGNPSNSKFRMISMFIVIQHPMT